MEEGGGREGGERETNLAVKTPVLMTSSSFFVRFLKSPKLYEKLDVFYQLLKPLRIAEMELFKL